MRIALISSEFSGLKGSGGIGSYFLNLARSLTRAGMQVEVFTMGIPGDIVEEPGVLVHHLGNCSHAYFVVRAAEAFSARHNHAPFDILESAELNAEGFLAAQAVPEVASVVRMHSPSVLLNRYLDIVPSIWGRIKFFSHQISIAFGAFRRGIPISPIHLNIQPPLWFPSREIDERNAAASADLIIVMSEEMRLFVTDYWWIKEESIAQTPNPILFDEFGKSAQSESHLTSPYSLGFLGRLEPRKGVLELAKALQIVLPKHPEWRVVFSGQSMPSCLSGTDVGKVAKELLKDFGSQVTFLGSMSSREVPKFLLGLDLCVFPSLWDNFPYVVMEAMAAGKAILATRVGAVPEMLGQGEAGRLVDAGDIGQLAKALDHLMANPDELKKLGLAARNRLNENYSPEKVTELILNAYRLALQRRDQRVKAISSQ